MIQAEIISAKSPAQAFLAILPGLPLRNMEILLFRLAYFACLGQIDKVAGLISAKNKRGYYAGSTTLCR
ncbi:hypothetical protein DPQ22_08645 [Candidatus Tokpelaia sp.]|nr:hypothetical protein DPQ22_08645 [Candidatus Tokpelaia sp.]